MTVGKCLARYGSGGAIEDSLYESDQTDAQSQSTAPLSLTRLWSMISVMTATLPVEGPDFRRTTAINMDSSD